MRPRAQARVQLDHAGFPQRVNGWVGDLGEALSEEGIDRPRGSCQWRNRCVVAHRPDGVFALHGHGLQDHVDVFFGVAKAQLQLVQIRRIDRGNHSGRIQCRAFQQLFVLRRGAVEKRLQLLILIEDVVLKIGQHHLAWAEATAVHDLLGIEIHQSGFRASNHQVILGDEESTRPQAVAIQRRANDVPVGKGNRRRSVPRLNAVAVIGQEGRMTAGIARRHHHADRLGNRAAIASQQFDHFVEAG